MIPLKDYYEKEIRYFIEESQRFAEKHPRQAHALNLTDVRERDPYAERLIEAFAFLTGSISKRIDDDFSDLALDLLSVIWPHYLHPLPSSVILNLKPEAGLIQSGKRIERKRTVETNELSTGLRSRFTTCTDCLIRPIQIEDARFVSLRSGQSAIRLGFTFRAEGKWEKMDHGPLLIYLHGDTGVASILYYILLKDIRKVIVTWNNGAEHVELSKNIIKPGSLSPEPENALLPFPDNSFAGFRLLEEFFYFSDRFRFVSMDIFQAMSSVEPDTRFEVDLILSGEENWRIEPTVTNFKLNCVPAINLYSVDADPITLDSGKMSHRLSVNKAESDHSVPYHIENVSGIRLKDGSRHEYQPFLSYKFDIDNNEPSYYYAKRFYNVKDEPELSLSVIRPRNSGKEVISIQMLCGNDPVIREVHAGDICNPCDLPDYVKPVNLSAPTLPVWPKLGGKEIWTIVNCLALNYNSINTLDSLQSVLSMYNRNDDRSNNRRINGIRDYKMGTIRRIFKGYALNGVQIQLTLSLENFINRGDMLMFSYILSKVFSMYVPINTFCELNVTEYETQKKFMWQVEGEQAIL
ncbi:Type VI secretion system [Candidatus Magnetomorum sp. HK-1]|nr:Type VI secretion system [Candidatus Magnetomorum sp. HK-1]